MAADRVATAEGTAGYQRRMAGQTGAGHFRRLGELALSSIGVGTYLGEADAETDRLYQQAIARAVELGCNVIDTAINYRCQRSERAIGRALAELGRAGRLRREEVVIATKGGFLPYDDAPPPDPWTYIQQTFLAPGIFTPDDLVAGCHCLTPRYLQHQLDRSLRNLGVEGIDIYYLHNPETQLTEISRDVFDERIKAAFELLERNVTAGKLSCYGAATWNGFRASPESRDFLSLDALIVLAEEVAGPQHHFRVIQLPYNAVMSEAAVKKNQPLDGKMVTLLEAARRRGIYVMSSASVLQGQLNRGLPEPYRTLFAGLDNNIQRSIQFVRSTPGVGTALVGMKQSAHVEENLRVAKIPPPPGERVLALLGA